MIAKRLHRRRNRASYSDAAGTTLLLMLTAFRRAFHSTGVFSWQSELHFVITGETMSTLGEFLARIQQVETSPCPAAEEWADLINRISVPGRIAEVTEDTYWYFLEVLP